MGNTERHSFNFILSTVHAALYNVIISTRSAEYSDRAMLSRHRGEMQIDFISAVAFLRLPHVTKTVISGKDRKIRGKCQTVEGLYYTPGVVYSDHRLTEQDSS